ncbi:hypothetical protein Desaci_0206 [Desulfosporosinus acidiphilus SJ4]|uniref:DUF4829 domain-containing protein n=1 Tax=Desulfosporosinus acidiphilus (strain DSM 22704 / JCM 16185 / SJ4) TaxID=646529 RepID=I4D0F6_DESAJ|nr:hypothetical protein [Desulfosporosinus acidiphilus]AFM39280.1 hypothetical protein Desaci_0206 [Desulfosporosinus acidiphilus SJ4]
MAAKVKMLGSVLICILFLLGCSNQSSDLAKENSQLKTEIQSLKQQVDSANNKVKQQAELYDLRNNLDNDLHNTLTALIKGDYQTAEKNLAPSMRIQDKKLITKTGSVDYEFIIPDRPMNLRQRTYLRNGDNYTAVYEIYDAGYTSGNKYDDRTNTLNVAYSLINGQWKLSSLMIDE